MIHESRNSERWDGRGYNRGDDGGGMSKMQKKTRMLTIHGSHDMIIQEKEDKERGDEGAKCKRKRGPG